MSAQDYAEARAILAAEGANYTEADVRELADKIASDRAWLGLAVGQAMAR